MKLTIFHHRPGSGTTLLTQGHGPWRTSHQHRYSRLYNLRCCMILSNQQFAVRKNYRDVWSYFFVPRHLRLCRLWQTTSTIRTGLDPLKLTVKRDRDTKTDLPWHGWQIYACPCASLWYHEREHPLPSNSYIYYTKYTFQALKLEAHSKKINLRDGLGIVSNWR